jgi:hypothetical protein
MISFSTALGKAATFETAVFSSFTGTHEFLSPVTNLIVFADVYEAAVLLAFQGTIVCHAHYSLTLLGEKRLAVTNVRGSFETNQR